MLLPAALFLAGVVVTVAVDPFEVSARAASHAPAIESTAFVTVHVCRFASGAFAFERLAGPKRLVVYPDGHLVLLWDELHETVLRDIDPWLRDHHGALPSLQSTPRTGEEYSAGGRL